MKRPIIVAEIGINHQGDFDLAKRMTTTALGLGADYVKFQVREPEFCVPRDQWDKQKLTPWGETMSYLEYRKKMEFSSKQLFELFSLARGKMFVSVFDIFSLDKAMKVGFDKIKIPSAMLTNTELLQAADDSGREVIISTGMSTQEEIVTGIRAFSGKKITIMHCNSSYPTKDEETNLRALGVLKSTFPQHSIGFSSHNTSPYPAIYAMALGAEMIELHFTLDRTMHGSDHAASLEPAGLALVARERDRLMKVMGDGILKVYDSEKSARKKLRGS